MPQTHISAVPAVVPAARRVVFTRRLVTLAAVAAVAGAGLVPVARADEEAKTPDALDTITLSPAQLAQMVRGGLSAARQQANTAPPVAEVADGLKHTTGQDGSLFGIYHAEDPVFSTQGKILAALPQSLLNTDLLLATSIGSGSFAGFQWSDYLVRMERRGDEIALMVPDLFNRGQGTVASSVTRTYQPRVLVTLPIVARGEAGEVVVDMAPLTLGSAIPIPGSAGVNRNLSRHTNVKVFPDNVLIEAERATSGSVPTLVSFAFRKLPREGGYQPRVADERVGYFETTSQDWGKPHDARETTDRYVNRWNLQKLDESLDKSPPVEPIVFYIEKTVPIRWRQAVREGVLEWNKAFEEIGIVGAIEVRQQTDTQYADLDPEDARYNFVRWIVSGRPFAMGPSRVDPRTGQILDADIIFDDSMLRFFQDDLDLLSPKGLVETFGPERLSFWAEHPAFRPMGVEDGDVRRALGTHDVERQLHAGGGSNMNVQDHDTLLRRVRQEVAGAAGMDVFEATPVASRTAVGHGACHFADGLRRQMTLSHLAAVSAAVSAAAPATRPTTQPAIPEGPTALEEAVEDAAEKLGDAASAVADVVKEAAKATHEKVTLPDAFLALIVKEVMAHEVGHTLGLRHNFKASSWLDLDEIRSRRGDATQPTSASVMDYNPVLLFAGDDPSKIETFVTPVLGPYDFWAVRYGYKPLPRRTERQDLLKIASESGKPEHAYATDEDVSGPNSPDPDANRFDMGSDPVAWARARVELADELLETFEEWAVGEGERNTFLRQAFLSLFFERVSSARYVVRRVGGQHFNRTHFKDAVADTHAPGLTPLSAAEQREALAFVAETVFADGFFDFDPALLNRLVADRLSDTGRPSARIDFPIHDTVLRAQNAALTHLCDPTVLQRVYDAELKAARDDDRFTASEVIRSVMDAIWTGLDDGAPADSLRRNLQQQHAQYLLAIADMEPGRVVAADLRNQVRFALRQLAERLEAVSTDDWATAAHYAETRERIVKVLDAPHMKQGPAAGPSIILMLGQEGRSGS